MPDHGDGLWSVPVPIPGNPLGKTLVYVLESPKGPVLIDAGWEHPESWKVLKAGLLDIGTSVEDVYGVVVTHMHPDHAGLAGRIRERSGAWIAMHRNDAELVEMIRTGPRGEMGQWVTRAGAPPSERIALTEFDSGVHAPARPDRILEDRELVDLPGRTLRAILTPGHTPGHICLHDEDRDLLFTGDHLLPEITPHVGLYPYDRPDVDPLRTYMDALQMTAELGVDDAMPAHQYAFSGIPRRAKEIIEHHEERLAEVAAIVPRSGATLWEVAQRCHWSYTWEEMLPISRHLATGETAAHLRTLENRGIVHRVGAEDPIRFAHR
ncbi:MBL fold metallo-hydrolase [Actinocorallia longicatena]|uniref:MBL fold metallo-hydrolase n=1 Tax=Actinocorallia longicatena TaxID=111803 RepID=A0ABP6Q1D0_9ACTN